jgi:hypothetical protein
MCVQHCSTWRNSWCLGQPFKQEKLDKGIIFQNFWRIMNSSFIFSRAMEVEGRFVSSLPRVPPWLTVKQWALTQLRSLTFFPWSSEHMVFNDIGFLGDWTSLLNCQAVPSLYLHPTIPAKPVRCTHNLSFMCKVSNFRWKSPFFLLGKRFQPYYVWALSPYTHMKLFTYKQRFCCNCSR